MSTFSDSAAPRAGSPGAPGGPAAPAAGPLQGVRVLEVSSVIMAPFAGRILAQLGARVTKLEPPGGDVLRRTGVPEGKQMSGTMLILNEGKDSIEVDAKTQAGRELLRELIQATDVVVTNLLPQRREQYGLDWESISHLNPRAILCTGQGYGSESDLADRPAYDDTIQAASGLCDVNRFVQGQPAFSPFVMADKVSGMAMVYSLLAALYRRSVDGQGQWVDVPMLDVLADFNSVEQLNDHAFEPPAGPAGWHRTIDPDRRPHPATDGWVCVLPYTDRDWRAFTLLLGRPKLAIDPRCATPSARARNIAFTQGLIAEFCRDRTVAEVIAACEAARIPCQEVATLESLTSDPYLRSRGSMTQREHPTEGAYWSPSPGIRFSGTPTGTVKHTPHVDEDRAQILHRLESEKVQHG